MTSPITDRLDDHDVQDVITAHHTVFLFMHQGKDNPRSKALMANAVDLNVLTPRQAAEHRLGVLEAAGMTAGVLKDIQRLSR